MSTVTLTAGQPVKAYNFAGHTYVRFRVIGNGKLFLGKTSGEVLSKTGTVIVAGDGLIELHWVGELWANCDVNSPQTQYNIDPDEAYAPPNQTDSPAGTFRIQPPAWQDPKNQTFDYMVRTPSFFDRLKRALSNRPDYSGKGRNLFHKE